MPPFEELYRAYFAEVYRYALALCRHKETAEDVTAETFLKAMRRLGSFRGDCDFKVWLFGIAKNTYYSMLRKDAKLTGEPPEETAADAPTPEDAVLQSAEAMEIHKALHALPEPYKEVFSLRTFGELSFRQIGELFGKTEHWACVTYHRAKEKLRQEL
ncbi:MAG: sigma-70 family RNA polymerase sigma factor [Clostridia bacterium]|nr:sigma-70 family RNA polymerase sigma factor [Clostridia bacterium]